MNVSDPKHPHHAVWREHVQSVLDGAPKGVEYLYCGTTWVEAAYGSIDGISEVSWSPSSNYRIARPMVTRTITYPAPMTVAPAYGTTYWTINTIHGTDEISWADDRIDKTYLRSGMCWATEVGAIEAAKAIFGDPK